MSSTHYSEDQELMMVIASAEYIEAIATHSMEADTEYVFDLNGRATDVVQFKAGKMPPAPDLQVSMEPPTWTAPLLQVRVAWDET